MSEIIIEKVRLDSNGQVRVRPAVSRSNGYAYIWRDATNVAWDETCGELYPRDALTPVEGFDRIIAAVAPEYGDKLTLSPSTVFVELPSSLIAVLRGSAS